MEKGTPPQEEDAPVECREPRLSLERKLLHGEGGEAGKEGGLESSFKNTRDIWQQIPLHFLSPGKSPYLLDNTQLE